MKKHIHIAFSAVIIGAAVGISAYCFTKKKQKKAKAAKVHIPYGPYEVFFKPILDAFLAAVLLLILGPVMVCTLILIKLKLGKPIFFLQDRPGKNGKIFKIYKFRTMTNEKDKDGNLLSDEQRTTDFGLFLRKTSLDELPELFNIVKGDMSIIGPRPLLTEYLPYYSEQEKKRHDVRPGLTGLAQINGRNNLSWDKRFELDIQYVNHISFLGDMKILFQTIYKVFFGSDVSKNTKISEGNFAELRKAGKI